MTEAMSLEVIDRHIKLSLSGGGFRSTFFCLGAYRQLFKLGIHDYISSINSVSGGSITAGQILYALSEKEFSSLADFDKRVTKPLIRLGQCDLRRTIMRKMIYPTLPRKRFSQVLPKMLDEHLFHNKRMNELTLNPELSLNATCLNTGRRFRFKQNDMGGHLLGVTKDVEDIKVSKAVACSMCFPMMFFPIKVKTKGKTFFEKWWTDNPTATTKTIPDETYLTDGGVYDNLGSESILHEKKPFLIFDASSFLEEWEYYKRPNWFTLSWRPLDAGLEQIVLLRRRLIYNHAQKVGGCLLMLRDPISNLIDKPDLYGCKTSETHKLLEYPQMTKEQQHCLGRLRTDLDGFHDIEIKGLIWAGEIRADIAVRLYFPELLSLSNANVTPQMPDYPETLITKVLKKGARRSYLKSLHKRLH